HMKSRRRKIKLASASKKSAHEHACSAAWPTYDQSGTPADSPVSSERWGTYSMRLGTTLLTVTPKSWIGCPNTRAGRRASVSAERPTTNSENVNTAVKNGDENAENKVAMPMTIATSHIVNTPKPTSTRRSS